MMSGGKTPTLSQLLQEAKADAEERVAEDGASSEQLPITYSRLFDEYKGTRL